jgi:hypothetical protein
MRTSDIRRYIDNRCRAAMSIWRGAGRLPAMEALGSLRGRGQGR